MVATLDLIEAVAHRGAEVVVRGKTDAFAGELDDGLGTVDLIGLALLVLATDDLVGDVGGELDDLHRPSLAVDDGVVACLDPDDATALADTLVLVGKVLAGVELTPEGSILGTNAVGIVDEQTVMLSFDLVERVTDGVQGSFDWQSRWYRRARTQ